MTIQRSSYIYVGLAGETAPGRPVQSGLYRMVAGDDRWEVLTRGLPQAPAIRAIVTHPDDADTVYVGTQHGPYRSTDNALVEGKNGAVIRKQIGYGPISAVHADEFQRFYTAWMNPYLNFHRPCGFATIRTTDRRCGPCCSIATTASGCTRGTRTVRSSEVTTAASTGNSSR